MTEILVVGSLAVLAVTIARFAIWPTRPWDGSADPPADLVLAFDDVEDVGVPDSEGESWAEAAERLRQSGGDGT